MTRVALLLVGSSLALACAWPPWPTVTRQARDFLLILTRQPLSVILVHWSDPSRWLAEPVHRGPGTRAVSRWSWVGRSIDSSPASSGFHEVLPVPMCFHHHWRPCQAVVLGNCLVDEPEGWYRLTAVLDFGVFNWSKKNWNSTQIILEIKTVTTHWSGGRLQVQLEQSWSLSPSSSPCLSSGNHSPWLFQKSFECFECKNNGRALGAALRHSLGGSTHRRH